MESVECDFGGGTLPLLRSRVLAGFAHGFTTRAGGVSPPPYASLNMGRGWGDGSDNVVENRRRLQAACGAERLFLVKQVHGCAVIRVDASSAGAPAEADALVTDRPGAGVAVFSADCVPLLVADPVTGVVAAIHAGWRGVIAAVAPAAIAALTGAFGCRAGDLRVALGPAIGPCCFEVGPEVAAAFADAFPGAPLAHLGPAGKSHIDLKQALRRQLEAAGVPAAQIDAGSECTRCDPARFYSYRRDTTQGGGKTGQHLALIVARAPARPSGLTSP